MQLLFGQGWETHIVNIVLGSVNTELKIMDKSVPHVRFRKKWKKASWDPQSSLAWKKGLGLILNTSV